MLYIVKDCCDDDVYVTTNLSEIPDFKSLKEQHCCFKRGFCPCGQDCDEISFIIEQVDIDEDPDERYEEAVEYELELESLRVMWEMACQEDPELLDK